MKLQSQTKQFNSFQVLGLDKIQKKYINLPKLLKDKFAKIYEFEIKLNVRKFSDTGALLRSIKVEAGKINIIFKSTVPYANIQDNGGTMTVTEKQRKRFWALFYQTGKDIYKRSALSKTITIKAKHYTNVSPSRIMRDLNAYTKKITK